MENIDIANSVYWVLRDFVNATGSDKEILKWPHYYEEALNEDFRVHPAPSGT